MRKVEIQEYPCPAWTCEGIPLTQAGVELPVLVNPFSPSCQVSSIPKFVSTLTELEQAEFLKGRIVVLMGDLTSQVIACKSWFLIEERDIGFWSCWNRNNRLRSSRFNPNPDRSTGFWKIGNFSFPLLPFQQKRRCICSITQEILLS